MACPSPTCSALYSSTSPGSGLRVLSWARAASSVGRCVLAAALPKGEQGRGRCRQQEGYLGHCVLAAALAGREWSRGSKERESASSRVVRWGTACWPRRPWQGDRRALGQQESQMGPAALRAVRAPLGLPECGTCCCSCIAAERSM
jgi:hypothetical protein